MSDVYAMGGRVLFALSIAAFPEELPRETMTAIFAGAAATVREGGGVLAGGHTIKDPEPKYGLAVIGAVHPDRILRKGGAQAGRHAPADQAAGHRHPRQCRPERPHRARAPGRGRGLDAPPQPSRRGRARGVRRPRCDRRDRLRAARPRDGDGAGLRAHGSSSRRGSSRRSTAPWSWLLHGVETGGAAHNRRFAAPTLTIHPGVDRAREVLAFDPQTSGGLLAAVPNDRVATVVAGFGAAGVSWWRVGRVESGEPGVELVA